MKEIVNYQRGIKFYLLLGFVVLLSFIFIINNALPYFDINSPVYDTEKIRPFTGALLAHILFGIVALLSGVSQFYTSISKRNKYSHRFLGRLYFISVLLSALASIYLSVFHAIIDRGYITFGIGLLGLAFAWLSTSVMAFVAIINKQISQHREWVLRSYVVTCGFILFRMVFGTLEQALQVNHIDSGNIAAWVCWSVPLLITEMYIQGKRINEKI
jgi:drug/metabolite transporter (DMT)-like permease